VNKSENVYQSGQALWLDNINRSVLLNGWLSDQIQSKKIWGLTSNPSIFQKAISGSDVYLSDIQSMSWLGYTSSRIYEEIAVRDVQDAADLLHPVYMDTDGNDGYISLEVNPDLANKADETVSEAKRLWSKLNRENIFIKIPATIAGISAIRDVIAAGINVNVTLIFSIERYRQVINAYFEGLEKRIEARKNISNIRSVASFFISRIDRVIDNQLQNLVSSRQRTDKHPADLLGKIGIANALQAYQVFLDSTSGERFRKLAAKGGQLQRPLWASTSTKNPDYPDTLYIDSLIMPDTVNTIPNLTLDAYLDHGSTKVIDFSKQVKVAMAHLSRLDGLGINFGKVTKKLEDDGVKAFSDAQKELLSEIENLRLEYGRGLNPLSENIATVLENLDKEKFYSRLSLIGRRNYFLN
jgi:transaldolase